MLEISMSSKPLCIIPARGRSKRLTHKNIVDFCGKPMIAYTIEAALGCSLFEQVNVSTEDQEIARIAREYGATVPYQRPHRLATDQASVVEVCLHMLQFFESQGVTYDTMCVLLPSSPLRTSTDIRGTYNRFLEAGADFALAVTSYFYHPWQALIERDGYLQPYWSLDLISKKSQQMPQLWVDSGTVYFARVDAFRRTRTFYSPKLVGYPIPPERAIDVDNTFQLYLARLLLADNSYRNSD